MEDSTDSSGLAKIVEQFSGKRVAVVGDVMLDEFNTGRIERLNPERKAAPLLNVSPEIKYAAGGAANVAVNLADLGASVTLIGVIGDEDEYQRALSDDPKYLQALRNHLNNVILLRELEKRNIVHHFAKHGQTLVKQRFYDSERGDYLLRADHGEFTRDFRGRHKSIPQQVLSPMLTCLSDKIKSFNAIVLSDYDKGLFNMGWLGPEIIKLARTKNTPVIVDPKPANAKYFIGATLVRPNEDEARKTITGVENAPIREVASYLRDKLQADYAVITRGGEGLVACSYDGQFYEVPATSRKLVDVTGAGDTTIAALTLGLISRASLKETLNLASYAAGLVVEKPGTATTNQQELIRRIREDIKF